LTQALVYELDKERHVIGGDCTFPRTLHWRCKYTRHDDTSKLNTHSLSTSFTLTL